MACAWAVAAALLFWPALPGRWRRALALGAGLTGVALLGLALRTEGVRETQTRAVYLLGQPFVTDQAQALASLPLYLLSGTSLLLGMLGLVASDAFAEDLSRRWLAHAIGLSLGLTALRFALEKAAAPAAWAEPVGVTWIAPVIGAHFAWHALRERRGFASVAIALVAYGVVVRASIAALMVAATTLRLGSHYDISRVVRVVNPLTRELVEFVPGSFDQVFRLGVLPQLLVWPLYTLVSGLLGAGLLALLRRSWPGPGALTGGTGPQAAVAP